MPRPRKIRMIQKKPVAGFFKPQGIPLSELKGVNLPVEGLEAIRLADVEGLDQETASEMMGISRPTFSRVLTEAHQLVGRALVNGWAIRIAGGEYAINGEPVPTGSRGGGRGRGGQGRGRRR